MEVSKLLEIIRIKLADPLNADGCDEGSLFKTDELIYYINNALREAVFRGKLLVKQSYVINLKAGTSEYVIPKGAYLVTQALDENKHDIDKVQEVDLHQNVNSYNDNFGSTIYRNDWRNDTSDLPYYYMQNTTNNKLLFYPIPTKDSIVNIRALYLPTELDKSDDIPSAVSEIYQRDLLYWVLFESFDKKDADTYEANEAEINKQRFTEIFGEKLTGEQFQEMLEYPDNPGSMRDY